MIDLSTSSDGEAALRAARECLAMEFHQCFDSSMAQRRYSLTHCSVFWFRSFRHLCTLYNPLRDDSLIFSSLRHTYADRVFLALDGFGVVKISGHL